MNAAGLRRLLCRHCSALNRRAGIANFTYSKKIFSILQQHQLSHPLRPRHEVTYCPLKPSSHPLDLTEYPRKY